MFVAHNYAKTSPYFTRHPKSSTTVYVSLLIMTFTTFVLCFILRMISDVSC